MPTTKYRCVNFGGCNKALEREDIEIEDGQEPICPGENCGLKLEPIRKPGPPRVSKWIFAVVAAILISLGLAVWLSHSSPNANPDAADKMLSDFYPQLPPK